MTTLRASFTKKFPGGPEIVVDQLLIEPGVTILFGPSGAGKTTLLRCLAGLEQPDRGKISLGEFAWFDCAEKIFRPPERRRIGLVPQDGALFPHLTVAENIAYGLNGLDANEKNARITEAAAWLGITNRLNHRPGTLSGGERQRTALARALVRKPDLLLLDEPLSALDVPMRQRLRTELRQLLVQASLPTLLVTHDRTEALVVGDRMAAMIGGRIHQQGTVLEVLSRPASLDVASLTGTETILPGRVEKIENGLVVARTGTARLISYAPDFPADIEQVYICIRAEDVVLAAGELPPTSARNQLRGEVISTHHIGGLVQIEVDCGFLLKVHLTAHAVAEMNLKAGTGIVVLIKAPLIHLIPA